MLSDRPREQGWMVYPGQGWRRFVFKLPVYFWRLGLARLNAPNYLLLSTFGRRTGRLRRTMLEYTWLNGHRYLMSGWGMRSDWSRNLIANPCLTAQSLRHGTVRGKAVRVSDAQEFAELYAASKGKSPVWKEYLGLWGIQDDAGDFLNKRDRLVIWRIDAGDEETPPPLGSDWAWVWPLAGTVAVAAVAAIAAARARAASRRRIPVDVNVS